jgi:hypothetical protein
MTNRGRAGMTTSFTATWGGCAKANRTHSVTSAASTVVSSKGRPYRSLRANAVSTSPGATRVTRTPYRWASVRSSRVKPTVVHFRGQVDGLALVGHQTGGGGDDNDVASPGGGQVLEAGAGGEHRAEHVGLGPADVNVRGPHQPSSWCRIFPHRRPRTTAPQSSRRKRRQPPRARPHR